MKKILVIALAALMLAVMAVPAFAAETAFVEVASFDFSNTDGLKGYTASYAGDEACNAAASEVLDGAIVDGKFVTGSMGFMLDEAIDASKGFKVTLDISLDHSKIAGNPWFQGIITVLEASETKDDVLALSGNVIEHSITAYSLNLKGNGKHVQAHGNDTNAKQYNEDGSVAFDGHYWGGDFPELDMVDGQTYAVEYTVVPGDNCVDVTIKVDGEVVELPNDTVFPNYLSEDMIVMIGATPYGDYACNATIDNVVVYTMQEVPEGSAPQTGVATIALAIAAIASGAYIVSKKH